MRLTFFGLTLSSSWANGHATPYRSLLRALHRLGHQVTFFEKDVYYYARHRDFTTCDYCDLVLYSDWPGLREKAVRLAAESDVVVTASYLPDGARINDELLSLQRPLRVYYDLDTPITLAGLHCGDEVGYVRASQLKEFDLVLSFTGGRALQELRDLGARNVRALYGSVDPDIHRRVDVPPSYRYDFSCMGTYSPDRQQKVEELFNEPARALPRKRFVLAGSNYPWPFYWPLNVTRFEHVGPADHSAFYSSSSATLNITRAEMAEYGHCPSGRLFEAAACSTAVVSDVWDGIGEFFTPGDELLVANSAEDVLAALDSSHDLTRIGARAHQRTLDEHTGMHRARQFILAVEQASRMEAVVAGEAA